MPPARAHEDETPLTHAPKTYSSVLTLSTASDRFRRVKWLIVVLVLIAIALGALLLG